MSIDSNHLVYRLCLPSETEESWELERQCWAPFNWEAEGATGTDYDPALHVVAYDAREGRLVATIDACPMDWDGVPSHLPTGGWTEVVELANLGFVARPRYACALGASILPSVRSAGISRQLLLELRKAAIAAGYRGLLAPVRPTARQSMPHLTISEYAGQRLPDGRHFDPWARTHEAVGGQIIGSCVRSAYFRGSREDWERWTGMRLPDSGRVLAPMTAGWLHLTDGVGVLEEDSLWLYHRLSSSEDPAAALDDPLAGPSREPEPTRQDRDPDDDYRDQPVIA